MILTVMLRDNGKAHCPTKASLLTHVFLWLASSAPREAATMPPHPIQSMTVPGFVKVFLGREHK